MKNSLTVILVLRSGGDFSFRDVDLLAYHLNQRFSGDIKIKCLYDKVSESFQLRNNLELLPMTNHWPGWWSKMNLFSPEMEKYRPFLFMDLDTAVVGNLNDVFPPVEKDKFIFLENCYYPNQLASGIMWFPKKSEKISQVWDHWLEKSKDCIKQSVRKYGDQDFIKSIIKADAYWDKNKIDTFKPKPKQHWREQLSPELSIVYFHGKPRIPQAAEKVQWVQDYINKKGKFQAQCNGEIQEAYVINLDERKDRLREFQKQKFPFKIERFPALKGNPGIVGCNKSHLAVLKKNHKFPFIVFEDDCLMIQDWSVVEKAMSQLPEDWDMLYLGANLNVCLERYSENLFRLKDAWTAHAIIFGSQRVVDFILLNKEKIMHIDVFYAKKVTFNFNCFIIYPMAATQQASNSDITRGFRDYRNLLINNYKRFTQSMIEFKAQVGQDKWVSEKFNYKRNGFFIDIGAYDGEYLSNTYYLEKELGWTGICVEPINKFFRMLTKKRNCICVNKAIYSENKIVEFGKVGFVGGIKKGGNSLVEAITMKKLMNDNNAPKIIDYISIDVDGSEYDVLLGFPFNEYEVILWTIEHNSYLNGGVLKEQIKKIMTENGYLIARENVENDNLPFEDWYINKKYI